MMTRKLPGAALVMALVLTTSACGGSDDPEGGTAPTSASDSEGSDFCGSVAKTLSHIDLVTNDEPDMASLGDDIKAAYTAFSAIDPPAEVAADWQNVEDTFKLFADAYEGVDTSDPAAVEAANDTLGEEVFGRVVTVSGSGEKIAAFAQEECDLDLGIDAFAVTDACELITADDLARVFGAADPEVSPLNYGQGSLECTWEGGENEVQLSIVPKDKLAQSVGEMEALNTSADLDGLDQAAAYGRFLGIGRYTKGSTVTFIKGGSAIMVAARTGEDGSESVDVGTAARLAKLINDQL